MKLKENINPVDFLKQIRTCRSDVYLETEDEDRLNLKSVLSQYVFIVLAEQKEMLDKAKVVCEGEEDYQTLAEYLTA